MFHGLTITTSPLEKINDLIKQEVTYCMNPLPIVMAVESIIKRLNKEKYKITLTKITRSHRDKHLLDVQVRLSERLFSVFYDNYIESYSVKWD